jgi:plasmid replication initiation protein
MVTETTKISELLPSRYPQKDLFICDVADAVVKDLMPHMEHPFYSLSKKPETTIREYSHNGDWLKIIPSVKGLATIYDKDILIYCISQIMHKINEGEKVSKRVRINTRDLLIFTNRGTSGRDYMALNEALERLRGTTISTNIRTGDEEQIDTFGLIETSSIRRKNGLKGRLLWCDVVLSDWVFNAIEVKQVLTLHPDYFRLRKPIERRVYEIARKHCGRKKQWAISISLLLKKSGSQSPKKRFRYLIKNLVEHDHLPDYRIEYNSDKDQVMFFNREEWWKEESPAVDLPRRSILYPEDTSGEFPKLQLDTYSRAKDVAPGIDGYYLEQEWHAFWDKQGRQTLHNPDEAFLGFCRQRHIQKP